MEIGRRFFLSSIAVALAGAKSLFAEPQPQGATSRFPQIPDASNSGRPLDRMPFPPPPDPKLHLKENEKNLRQDADHLLQLAEDLKGEADKTEQTDALSLSLIKKAEQAEKLARQIKDLDRAS